MRRCSPSSMGSWLLHRPADPLNVAMPDSALVPAPGLRTENGTGREGECGGQGASSQGGASGGGGGGSSAGR